MAGKRVAKWDNIKFCLMYLVILGHTCDAFDGVYAGTRALFCFIYIFHMPAFLFISGLFSNRTVNAEKLDWMKLTPYLILTMLLYAYRHFSIWLVKPDSRPHFLVQGNIAWFLFALFWMYVICHALRKFDWKYGMALCICIGVLAGYDSDIGKVLALSRILVYFPYFYLGYLLDHRQLERFLEKRNVKIGGAVILLAWGLLCITQSDWVYQFRPLITGQNSYASLPFTWSPALGLLRLIQYPFTLALMLGFFSLVPKKHISPFSEYGGRTLGTYFWHQPILYLVYNFAALQAILKTRFLYWFLFSLVFAAALLLLFSQKIFSVPLDYILHPKKSPLAMPDTGKKRREEAEARKRAEEEAAKKQAAKTIREQSATSHQWFGEETETPAPQEETPKPAEPVGSYSDKLHKLRASTFSHRSDDELFAEEPPVEEPDTVPSFPESQQYFTKPEE